MLVASTNTAASATVMGAIRQAASATGTSFDYLVATAQVESGLNPHADAATTSARGLFQFIEQTWLATLKDSGQALGYGRYAGAISKSASGRYVVADPALRTEILKLRNDPAANALMAGAFTKANAATLAARLGRGPSEGELYLAHFLGAGGAARLIALGASHPNVRAADIFPHAARANRAIFYDAQDNARSIAQVRSMLTARYQVARAGTATATAAAVAPAPAAPPSPIGAAPDTAGMTHAFASATTRPAPRTDDGPVFHGLFHDPDRRAPIAPVVSQLWGAPAAQRQGAAARTATAKPGGMRELFLDHAPDTATLFSGKS
jgi:hypothetical protein